MPVIQSTPTRSARIYAYWLGGTDWHDADRELADALTDPARGGYPGLRDMARENRRFVIAAVQRLAGLDGISQYLDLGCGLPAKPSVHETAQAAIPEARVAYIDNDPLVISHASRMAGDGVAVVEGDLTDPAAVLADPAVTGVLDLSRPVAVICTASLAFTGTQTAREAVAGYMDALPPGSALVASVASFADTELAGRLAAMREGTGWRNWTQEEAESLFAGLDLAGGRVGDVRRWPMPPCSGYRQAATVGGAGIKWLARPRLSITTGARYLRTIRPSRHPARPRARGPS